MRTRPAARAARLLSAPLRRGLELLEDRTTPALTLGISPAAVWEYSGVGAATGTVTRDGDLSQALTVNLSSNDATEATVFGPFFVEGSPEIANGGDMAFGASGEPCWVEGTVTDDAGNPLGGALIEVWEADADGRYDVQYADGRVAARAHLRTEPDGSYRFWAVTPTPYPIPHDGPVGDLLKAVGRSPMRTSHLHFMVSHPGCRTLVTHIFVRGDELLDSDAVFGVKDSLVKDFERQRPGTSAPGGRVVDGTWSRVRFDIVLAPAGA